ncbi:MAG: fructosamine kinase family protein [Rhizobiales bacterium]|nr:fructosamine kinase family protein [Hyphomicrobiales bacterium]NRB13859.1 fructosamine kinase family protein [Hyphomicrobiales bacterium]
MNMLDELHKVAEIIGEMPVKSEKIAQSYDLSIYKLEFKHRAALVAKHGHPKLRDHFEIEFKMLKQLNEFNFLPTPQAIYVSDALYLMDYIDNVALGHHQEAEAKIARKIAQLHDVKAQKFGFEYDTLIGSLLQPNRFNTNWIEFFRDQRLIYFADLCYQQKLVSSEFRHQIDKISDRLDELLLDNHKPTLIHGDLWYGNILTDGSALNAFIDPALYYANPEIELAYVTMHNSLGDDFFNEYQQHHQIEDGFFDLRKDIYNIYPHLIHILLCGPEYAVPVEAVFKRHGV